MRLLLLLLSFFVYSKGFGQAENQSLDSTKFYYIDSSVFNNETHYSESIGQFDKKGRKDGWWIDRSFSNIDNVKVDTWSVLYKKGKYVKRIINLGSGKVVFKGTVGEDGDKKQCEYLGDKLTSFTKFKNEDNGYCKEYYPNGKVKKEGKVESTYFSYDGTSIEPTGIWKYYDENGKFSHNKIINNGIKGCWKSVAKTKDYRGSWLHPDADFYKIQTSDDLYITNNEIHFFDYYREYYKTVNNPKTNPFFIQVDAKTTLELRSEIAYNGNDTLILTIGVRGNDTVPGDVINKTYFVRTSFNYKEVIQLKKDSLNANSCIGKWTLEKFHHSIDADPYPIDFAFTLPDSLVFTKENVGNIKGRIFTIEIEGVKREFRGYFEIDDFYNSISIRLQPLKWYKGKYFKIEYSKRYKSNK